MISTSDSEHDANAPFLIFDTCTARGLSAKTSRTILRPLPHVRPCSYLTRLQADGEATDDTGRVKTFHIEAFMQPYNKAAGNLSLRSTGRSDDSLTGTWDKAYFTKDQIILEYATGGEKYAFDGILRRDDDAEYRRLIASMEKLGVKARQDRQGLR